MIPRKLLITGIGPAASEDSIRAWMAHYGPVERVEIIREGDASEPVALVEMRLGDAEATNLAFRLTDYWHEGQLINVRHLHH